MNTQNLVCQLFKIKIPVIQAGMVWCAGWELASAVSNAGGLGLIGSGSMDTDTLKLHIQKCRKATDKPFGVNVPLLYPDIEKHIQVIIDEKVRIVFTSAGNPKTWTAKLKKHGVTVVHVVSSLKFALKAEEAGVNAVVVEGFEAGGHNGREETTTICLLPMVAGAVKIPVIAAGGIGSGKAMLAAMALGAAGVQIGTRFAVSHESSAHKNFKQNVIETEEGNTELVLKRLTPVRIIKNKFYDQVKQAESQCASEEQLRSLLGKGRSKKGIFEGNLEEGELEIGQVSALINEVKPAGEILNEIWSEFLHIQDEIKVKWNYGL